MKNLVLLTETRHCVSSAKEGDYIISQVPNPNADHDDPEFAESTETFHYLLTPSGTLSGVSSKDAITWSLNLNTFLDDDDAHSWFHLSHEENSDLLVALSKNGAIISVSPDGTNVELIGCFDHGIQCAAWSADKELLSLVAFQPEETDESILVPVLMTMNTQFEILSEVPLPRHLEGEAISVCWNKKTDNQFVAISTHDSEDGTRKIRFFKGDSLENVATSRTEDGSGKLIPNILAHADIAWAGSNTSNVLACVQRKGRKGRNIVFLEPNGLQHGGFKLEHRLDHEEVVRMDWNAESDLLAITLVGKGNNDLQYGKVQFYYRNNYHWYLKHEIQLQDGVQVSNVRFDEIKGYDVSISLQHTVDTSLQEWRDYRFIWDASATSERGTAVVVDGNNLNLTMLDKAMIPPPMFASQVTFDKSVAGVSHVPSYLKCSLFDILVHLSDSTLAFCNSSKIVARVDLSDAIRSSNNDISEIMDASCLRQFIVVDSILDGDKIVVKLLSVACSKASVAGGGPRKVEELVEFHVELCPDEEGNSTSSILHSNRIVLEGKVLRMVNWADSADIECEVSSRGKGGALIELLDGSLFQYTSTDGQVMPCEAEPMLLEPCPWIAGLHAEGGRQLIIGLSSRFRLYFGERQLCDASSSFILSTTHEFLGYVTLGSRSQLRFLPLKLLLDFDPLMGSDENLDLFTEGYEPRNVERGSTLVAILPEKPTAVLQLPRGNLEGVYPRALVLPHIMQLIDDSQYHLALDMMRRQKVDMNLIVDMNPVKCLEGGGLASMVCQVKKMDHLNLFLASLQDYDITQWKYRIPSWFRFQESNENRAESRAAFDFSTKVNLVCSKMRLLMMEREEEGLSPKGQFLLPILSTFAKQSPPQLSSALELIKENAEFAAAKLSTKPKSILVTEHAQSSIKYLAFLADYELLFDTALGMYDFDLAKAVARNSQMDPKVYLPMLKRLRGLPLYEAKYEVDVKLKRFESALRHLYKLGIPEFDANSNLEFSSDHFAKCKRFIEEHTLHQLGLELFLSYPSWHQEIMLSLGESLLRESKCDLSLAIFLSAKPPCYEGAKRAARMCGDYKTFFSCFSTDELTSDESFLEVANDVAHEIADGHGGVLSKREGYAAGAIILVDYCQEIDEAVGFLISAQMWFEARRLARLHGEGELEKLIIDTAVSYAKECSSDFESRSETFVETNKRYAEVVDIRRKAKGEGAQDGDEQNDETESLFSMASHASNSSMRSNMSASSVGSVTSVSSVISAGAASTFSLINNEESIRHKSKFNNIGKKGKKKKRTRRERLGTKPGSEEELQSLVVKLKETVIDKELSQIVSETIRFLSQVQKISIALEVFEGYESLKALVESSQLERIHKDSEALKAEEKDSRMEGKFYEKTILDCEDEVNNLRCAELPELLQSLSKYKIDL